MQYEHKMHFDVHVHICATEGNHCWKDSWGTSARGEKTKHTGQRWKNNVVRLAKTQRMHDKLSEYDSLRQEHAGRHKLNQRTDS